ncbi:hypothetical protein [Salinibaculum rarum]|uniref:hypothetical protein n=1 Tax=Salinibaculum rarum TaxID=3058903 RepID=UPI00265D6A0E|nr:hypothetical protein [Salinibaculum sp. KK48]
MEALELVPEVVELVIVGIGTVALSLASAYIELFAFATAQSGDTMVALWAGVVGVVLLTFAYFLGTDKLAAKVREFRQSTGSH